MARTESQREPVVVVTGASQGIGAAIAARFADEVPGARLALVARGREGLEQTVRHCRQAGVQAESFPADLTDPEQVERMATAVQQRYGAVDVLVNNAGRWRGGAVHEMPVHEFGLALQENLVSMFAVTRAFLAGMLGRNRGDIFFMSSTSGLEGLPNNAAYCAAKHGVMGLAKALRAEVAGRGIRVCCVCPGPTESPTWEGTGVDASKLMAAADVARILVNAYLLSGRSTMEDVVLRPPGYA